MPELERYCSFKAHQQQLLEVLPLPPSIGDGVLSLSAEAVQLHASGGCPRFAYNDAVSYKALGHISPSLCLSIESLSFRVSSLLFTLRR